VALTTNFQQTDLLLPSSLAPAQVQIIMASKSRLQQYNERSLSRGTKDKSALIRQVRYR
jgi:hypothetical protein